MHTLAFDNLADGLQTADEATLLGLGQTPACRNVTFADRTVQVRPGRARIAVTTMPGIVTLAEYYNPDSACAPAARLVVACADGSVWASTDAEQTEFAQIVLPDEEETPLVVALPVQMRQGQHGETPALYLVDGTAAVRRWHPVDGVTALTDLPAPTVAPTLVVVQQEMLGDSDRGNINGFYVLPDTTNNLPRTTDQFLPRAITWSDNEAGIVARLFTGDNQNYLDRTATVGLEIVSEGSAQWMSGEYWLTQTMLYARDISKAASIRVRYKIYSQMGEPSLYLQWRVTGRAGDDAWVELPGPLVGVADPMGDNWKIAEVDISAIPVASRTSVKDVALRCLYNEVRETNRLEQSATMALPSLTQAVTVLLDGIYPDIGEALFVPGDRYEFTYTYGRYDEEGLFVEEGGEQRDLTALDDGHNPYVTLDIQAADILALQIGVTLDADITPATPKTRLYARGGTSGDFRLIAEIETPSAGSYYFRWTGTVPPGADVLTQYQTKAPAGSSLLTEYAGRLVYANRTARAIVDDLDTEHNAVFLSNKGDGDVCPQERALRAASIYGGWEQVSGETHALTALGVHGAYLLAFTARRVYLGEEQVGAAPPIRFGLLDDRFGCCAPATVASLGGLTLWLDSGRICAFDGASVQDISLPVRRLLEGYSPAQHAAAWALADPVRHWYLVVFPDAQGDPCAATGLLLDLSRAAARWSYWTDLPNGGVTYLRYAPTPGFYSGEGEWLYRWFTDAQRATLHTDARPDGDDEEAGAGAAVAIPWDWWTRACVEPAPSNAKQVHRVGARLGLVTAAAAETLTLHLRKNGATSDTTSAARTVQAPAGSPSVLVPWYPALVGDAYAYQVGISGASTQAVELVGLTLDVSVRGRIR